MAGAIPGGVRGETRPATGFVGAQVGHDRAMPAMMPAPPPRDRPGAPTLPAIVVDTPPSETLEVRWLHAGPLPAELHDRCAAASGPGRTLERRVDTYLARCGDDVSVKVRGGAAIDVKQRCAPAAASVLVAGVQGLVEQWRKWTFGGVVGDGEAAASASPSASPTSARYAEAAQHWVPVAKTRCLVEKGPATVEFTELRTPGRLHWTVALEVPAECGLGALRRAAAALELGRFPRWFDLDASASYATFVEPPAPPGLDAAAAG